MTGLELLAILILAGAIIVLLYYYLIESNGKVRLKSHISNVGEKFTSEEGGSMSVSEKVSGVSDKIIHKVREVPISTDIISSKIDTFLEEKSDELIKDWELATKDDIKTLQGRLDLVSRNIGELEQRFNEYRSYTNKRLKSLDKRLKKLEDEIRQE
ncbi:MAG TPA: hypothetical protein PLO64_00945 [Methanothermobacter sp.]|nr:conserved hypothetical protein [Methanothermobacter sp. MT-2]HHW04815.1 hypothetical protein [Methanothermobacter sp.]HOK72174.1 hypothetical protein [Methanothermobacter sp.]HOL68487.1 hypothetical protein [Methanothermobacter sp.]HPQ04246.1 hypothetical protein [Methanothermobacter sp.]